MNRGEIRNKILWRLNQDTDDPQFWEEDYINNLIDDAYMNFVSQTHTLETSTTLSLVAYQHLYPLASNCLIVNRMYYETTDHIIDPVTWSTLVRGDPSWSITTGSRPEKGVFIPPNKIFLYPAVTSDSSDAVTYYYTKMSTNFINDAAKPDLPEMFHDALIEYSLAIALLRVGTISYLKKSIAYYTKYKEKIQSLRKYTYGRSARQVRIRSRF